METMAIVGAGFSGLVLAKQLESQFKIRLFDKAFKPGGRLASKRLDGTAVDQGAPFFKAVSSDFRAFLEPAVEAGVLKAWNGNFVEINAGVIQKQYEWAENNPHFVGTPYMRAFPEFLAHGLDIRNQTLISKLERKQSRWILFNAEGESVGEFDWVILTAPVDQSVALLNDSVSFKARLAQRRMSACFALMLTFSEEITTAWDAALVKNSCLSWISVCSSKPERNGHSVVALSSNDYADENMEQEPDVVEAELLKETLALVGTAPETILSTHLHRWRYANISMAEDKSPYIDRSQKIAACGDWVRNGMVESAFESICDLVREVL